MKTSNQPRRSFRLKRLDVSTKSTQKATQKATSSRGVSKKLNLCSTRRGNQSVSTKNSELMSYDDSMVAGPRSEKPMHTRTVTDSAKEDKVSSTERLKEESYRLIRASDEQNLICLVNNNLTDNLEACSNQLFHYAIIENKHQLLKALFLKKLSIESQHYCLESLRNAIDQEACSRDAHIVAKLLLTHYVSNYDSLNVELFKLVIRFNSDTILNQLITQYQDKKDDLNSIMQPDLIAYSIRNLSGLCFTRLLAYRPIIDTRFHEVLINNNKHTIHDFIYQCMHPSRVLGAGGMGSLDSMAKELKAHETALETEKPLEILSSDQQVIAFKRIINKYMYCRNTDQLQNYLTQNITQRIIDNLSNQDKLDILFLSVDQNLFEIFKILMQNPAFVPKRLDIITELLEKITTFSRRLDEKGILNFIGYIRNHQMDIMKQGLRSQIPILANFIDSQHEYNKTNTYQNPVEILKYLLF